MIVQVYENQEEMLKGARAIAAQIASNSPLVVQGTKVSLNYAEEHTTDEVCFPRSFFDSSH